MAESFRPIAGSKARAEPYVYVCVMHTSNVAVMPDIITIIHFKSFSLSTPSSIVVSRANNRASIKNLFATSKPFKFHWSDEVSKLVNN